MDELRAYWREKAKKQRGAAYDADVLNETFPACRRYERERHGVEAPRAFWSNDLRAVPLDTVHVNWLVGVLERLPGCGNAAKK